MNPWRSGPDIPRPPEGTSALAIVRHAGPRQMAMTILYPGTSRRHTIPRLPAFARSTLARLGRDGETHS